MSTSYLAKSWYCRALAGVVIAGAAASCAGAESEPATTSAADTSTVTDTGGGQPPANALPAGNDVAVVTDTASADVGCGSGMVKSPKTGECVPACGSNKVICAVNATCINSVCTCPAGTSGNGSYCCTPTEKYDPQTKGCVPTAAGADAGSTDGAATGDTASGSDGGSTSDTASGSDGSSTSDTASGSDGGSSGGPGCGGVQCGINTDCVDSKCTCKKGFTLSGPTCLDINECSDPAKIGCQGLCENTNGSYNCFGKGGTSSIADANTPFPETQCAGSVGPEAIYYQTHKTTFMVDCRCPPGSSQPGAKYCAAPYGTAQGGAKIGKGVAVNDHTSADIHGCSTDYAAKTVYFGVTWGNNLDSSRGYIMAVDPKTGDRTIVSGSYFTASDGVVHKGKGGRFDLIKDLALGPGGKLYVFEDSVPGGGAQPDDTDPDLQGRSIYSVDLTTGDRTLVWNHQTWKHPEFKGCSNGNPVASGLQTTDIQLHGFELDELGNFILATNANTNPSEGEGFIRVGKDGKSCQWLTRSSTKPDNLLYGVADGAGSGVEVAAGFDSGFGYKDGTIYATAFLTGSLYKIEVATGKRSMIWNSKQPTVGTGPGPGVWQFFYYPLFKMWIAGGNELGTPSNAAIFNPDTGDTWGWMYKKPDGTTTPNNPNQMGGGNDAYAGPAGVVTNQLRGPILSTQYQLLVDRPWCISPIEPNRLFVATDKVGVVIVEVETGNTMNLSL